MATIAKLIQVGLSPNQAKHLGSDAEYFTDIADWTPSLSFSGGMTITGATLLGRYARVGKLIFCMIHVSGTLATAAGTDVYSTLPVAPKAGYMLGAAGYFTDNAANGVCHLFRQSDTLIGIRKATIINWNLGVGFQAACNFFYEAAAGNV